MRLKLILTVIEAEKYNRLRECPYGCGEKRSISIGAVAGARGAIRLFDAAFFERAIGEALRPTAENQRLPIEEKESYRWLAAFQQTIELTPEGAQFEQKSMPNLSAGFNQGTI